MSRRKFTIRKMRLSDFKHFLLSEQDDLFGDEEEGGDEEAEGGDEAAEEEGGDEEAEGGESGDAATGGGGGGDEAAEEGADGDEEGEDLNSETEPVEATGPEDNAVDTELNALLMDFEAEALQIAIDQEPLYEPTGGAAEALPAEEDVMAMENISKVSISNFIFEQEGDASAKAPPNIDVDTYAGNVARLIQSYQSLLDMEGLIFDKAKNFLIDKYGEEVAAEFEEVLDIRHGFSMEPKDELPDQYAVGAAGSAAVGD
jgi:hypothetical protein